MYEHVTKLLYSVESVALFMHINPDADSVGSSLAMYKYLTNLGKKVDVFLEPFEEIRDNLYILPNIETINANSPASNYDLGIALDCASPTRLGKKMLKVLENCCEIKISFDHHKSYSKFTDILVLESNSASTTQILYKFFKENDKEAIDLEVATCLYAGLVSDSGNFSYNSTTVETFEVASELIAYGVDHTLLARVLYLETSYNAFNLSLRVLSNAIFHCDKKLAIITFSFDDFKSTSTKLVDTEGIVNSLVNVKEVLLALSIVEISNNEFKVGLRSKGNFDSSLIAEYFGGGGHKNASGCKVFGSKLEVLDKLVSISKYYIEKYDKNL